jgi:aspartokinase/homoserine dehydrogenase 1
MRRTVNAIPQSFLDCKESFETLQFIFRQTDILVLPTLTEQQEQWLDKAMACRNAFAVDYDVLLKGGLDSGIISLVLCRCKLSGDTEHNSARLAAKLGNVDLVFWSDEKLCDADRRYVSHARPIEHLSYGEAAELSFFGSKLLHSAHMAPAMEKGIAVKLACLSDPDAKGTIIDSNVVESSRIVSGFGLIENVALLSIEGPLMSGVPGVSSRLFTALSDQNVSVIMISQASSEYSICLAVDASVKDKAAEAAKQAMGALFADMIEVRAVPDCAIIAAVGERMAGSVGVSARLFSSLARANVSAKAISQGSMERNISVVVDKADVKKALMSLHEAFFAPKGPRLLIAGSGNVASALMKLLARRTDVSVSAICNSRSALLDPLSRKDWKQDLLVADSRSLESLMDSLDYDILVDCTASSKTADLYEKALGSGRWVVAANKDWASRKGTDPRRIGHEATVGAGLPLMRTLRSLKATGDEITAIEATLSGTLCWIFSSLDESASFSELVIKAHELGYTEPDPRMDLSGLDVARKAVILGKEMGMDCCLEDAKVQSLVPEGLEGVSKEEFLSRLKDHDSELGKLGKVSYVASIKPGCIECGLRPFDYAQGKNNAIVIYTKAYESGLVIQGPGAGADVTAYGVLADILDWRR